MEHNMHMVDILDRTGQVVGSKRRIEIRKPQDIYHTIHVILITPRGELVLSTIPLREDLPNLYAEQLGTTVATIRRSDESAHQAAQRAVSRELFIDNMQLTLLGERMYTLPSHRHNYMTTYYGISEAPESYSLLDIENLIVMMPRELDRRVRDQSSQVADSLIAVWEDYKSKLPI